MSDYRRLVMSFKEKSALFFATGAYAGRIPYIPGSIGSLWGLGAGFLLSQMAVFNAILAVAVFILAAAWSAHLVEKLIKKRILAVLSLMRLPAWRLPSSVCPLIQ